MRLGLQKVRRPEWAVRVRNRGTSQGLRAWFEELRMAPPQVEIISWRSFLAGWGPMVELVGLPVWREIESETVQEASWKFRDSWEESGC